MNNNRFPVQSDSSSSNQLVVNVFLLTKTIVLKVIFIILFIPRKILKLVRMIIRLPVSLIKAIKWTYYFAYNHRTEIRQGISNLQRLALKFFELSLVPFKFIKIQAIAFKNRREDQLESLSLELSDILKDIEILFAKIDESMDFRKYQNCWREFRKLKREMEHFRSYNMVQLLKEFKSYKEAKDYHVELMTKKATRIEADLSEIYSRQLDTLKSNELIEET